MTEYPVTNEREVERCKRERCEILTRPGVAAMQAPAWLVTLGLCDWDAEEAYIHAEFAAARAAAGGRR